MAKRTWLKTGLLLVVSVGVVLTLLGSLAGLKEPRRDWDKFLPVHSAELDSLVERENAAFLKWANDSSAELAPQAEWLTVARRVSLALIGCGLSLEEIRALEALPEAERVDYWTEVLLKDQRWPDYFSERLARAYVGTENGPFLLFRRRKFRLWLAEELQNSTPYDAIVREMISAEGLWTDKPAVNFVTATMDPENAKRGDPVRLAGRTSRAFLGMRIDCLQCHNDFLDKVNFGTETEEVTGKQVHFHQLASFFSDAALSPALVAGLRDQVSPYKVKLLNSESESEIEVGVPFRPDLLPKPGTKRERLAAWVTHPENKSFSRATVNRIWALLTGRALVEPVDDLPLNGPFPEPLEILAEDFAKNHFDLKRLIRAIVRSEAFRRASQADFEITAKHEGVWASFPITQLRPEQVSGSVIQSSQLKAIDRDSNWLVQLVRFGQINDFLKEYGDRGDDELVSESVTISQRLLLMNGNMVFERTKQDPLQNASSKIAILSRDEKKAVESVYLATLNRYPTEEESEHFAARIAGKYGADRQIAVGDIYWVLLNSTEFLWNH